MVGVDLRAGVSAPALAERALLEQRLVLNATGPATIRFEPPLVVSEAEVDDALARLGAVMEPRMTHAADLQASPDGERRR